MTYYCTYCRNKGCKYCGPKEAKVINYTLSDRLDGPLSHVYKPDKFEKFVLDYTASTTWEQIKDLDWTTAEMLDLVAKYIDESKAD